MSTKNDELVLQLFNKVKDKQREITKVENTKWLTSCNLGKHLDIVTDRVNLHTVNDIVKLVDLYYFMTSLEKGWGEAAKELGVKSNFKYLGFSLQDWKTDIKSRVGQIEVNKKKQELSELEARLDKLVSQEQRRELELAAISELLKD